MKLSATIALIATASAVRLMDEADKKAELVEKTLDAETLGDLGELTLEDLGEEGGECLLFSTGLTLLEHGVPEEVVAEVGEAMVAGAESGAPLSEGIEALRQLGEAYEADEEEQDKVLGDILGKVKACARLASGEEDEEDDDEDKEEEEGALAQKKGKVLQKLEDLADDDEDEDEDEDDEEKPDGEGEGDKPDELADDDEDKDEDEDEDKDEDEEEEEEEEEGEQECKDNECSSGTDLALAQIREESGEVVDKLAEDMEKLVDEAELDEEDLVAALDHIAEMLEEAGVDGETVDELGELLEEGDLEALEEAVADLSEEARAALLEAAEDIADEIEKRLGEKAEDFEDFKEDAGKELKKALDLDDEDDDDEDSQALE